MKNFIAFNLIIFCVATLHAQNTENAFADRINYIFQYVDKSQISTGLLQEYGVDFLNLDNYTGQQLHDSNYVGSMELRDLYNSLYSSQVRVVNELPHTDTFDNRLNRNKVASSAVGIAILNYEYNAYRDDAASAGLVTISNDQIYDVAGRSQSPYLTKRLFAIAPATMHTNAKADYFIFKPELLFTNLAGVTITDIAYDIGNGYTSVAMNTAFRFGFAEEDIRDVNFKITLSNGETLYSHTKIYIGPALWYFNTVRPLTYDPKPNTTLSRTIEGSKPYLGATGSCYAQVHLSSTNNTGKIRKPLIVAEGFDGWHITSPDSPRKNNDTEEFFKRIDEMYEPPTSTYNFHDTIDIEGEYDIIYIDFTDGTDYIQRNAYVVQGVINWVNSVKTTWRGTRQQNVIWGTSMGGLCTRWALKDMENNSQSHETRLFVSYDASHQGANYPLGLQMMTAHISSLKLKLGLSNLLSIPVFSVDDIAKIKSIIELNNRPAAKQMLIQRAHYIEKTQTTGYFNTILSDHQDFQNELDELGWPSQCKTIDVSNGSCSNQLLFPESSRMFSINARIPPNWGRWIIYSIILEVFGILTNHKELLFEFPLSIISTKTSLESDIWVNAVAPYFQNNQVYNNKIWIKKKILWVINVNTNIIDVNGYSGTSAYALDNVPAGYLDVAIFGIDKTSYQGTATVVAANIELLKVNYNASILQPKFSHAPRASTTNMTDALSNLRTEACRENLVCYDKTNFSDYYAPEDSSEGHVTANQKNAEFMFRHMENTHPDCITICDKYIIGDNILCTTSNTYTVPNLPTNVLVKWSASPSDIVTINSPDAFQTTLKKQKNGLITLTASIYNGCGVPVVITKENIIVGVQTPTNLIANVYYGGYLYDVEGTVTSIRGTSSNGNGYNWKIYYARGTELKCSQENTGTWYTCLIDIPEENTSPTFLFKVNYTNICGTGGELSTYQQYYNPNKYYSVSPNPTTTEINVKEKEDFKKDKSTKNKSIKELQLYNDVGNLVKNKKSGNGAKQDRMNIAGLKSGAYILKIISDDDTEETHHVLIQE